MANFIRYDALGRLRYSIIIEDKEALQYYLKSTTADPSYSNVHSAYNGSCEITAYNEHKKYPCHITPLAHYDFLVFIKTDDPRSSDIFMGYIDEDISK
jgi:hypothetical protein